MWLPCFREEWKEVNFYDCTVGIANLLILWGQLLTQNDSSLVLPIIREVLKNFGGARAPPMHKVAPPLDVHELGWDVFSTQLTMVD